MTETTTGILKQDSLGRVRTTPERREELVAEYERSGMSGAGFAALAGIKYQTFATWVQKRRRAAGRSQEAEPAVETKTVQWLEAVMAEKGEAKTGSSLLVAHLGMGARMEVSDVGGAALAAEVLRHLGGVKGC